MIFFFAERTVIVSEFVSYSYITRIDAFMIEVDMRTVSDEL